MAASNMGERNPGGPTGKGEKFRGTATANFSQKIAPQRYPAFSMPEFGTRGGPGLESAAPGEVLTHIAGRTDRAQPEQAAPERRGVMRRLADSWDNLVDRSSRLAAAGTATLATTVAAAGLYLAQPAEVQAASIPDFRPGDVAGMQFTFNPSSGETRVLEQGPEQTSTPVANETPDGPQDDPNANPRPHLTHKNYLPGVLKYNNARYKSIPTAFPSATNTAEATATISATATTSATATIGIPTATNTPPTPEPSPTEVDPAVEFDFSKYERQPVMRDVVDLKFRGENNSFNKETPPAAYEAIPGTPYDTNTEPIKGYAFNVNFKAAPGPDDTGKIPADEPARIRLVSNLWEEEGEPVGGGRVDHTLTFKNGHFFVGNKQVFPDDPSKPESSQAEVEIGFADKQTAVFDIKLPDGRKQRVINRDPRWYTFQIARNGGVHLTAQLPQNGAGFDIKNLNVLMEPNYKEKATSPLSEKPAEAVKARLAENGSRLLLYESTFPRQTTPDGFLTQSSKLNADPEVRQMIDDGVFDGIVGIPLASQAYPDFPSMVLTDALADTKVISSTQSAFIDGTTPNILINVPGTHAERRANLRNAVKDMVDKYVNNGSSREAGAKPDNTEVIVMQNFFTKVFASYDGGDTWGWEVQGGPYEGLFNELNPRQTAAVAMQEAAQKAGAKRTAVSVNVETLEPDDMVTDAVLGWANKWKPKFDSVYLVNNPLDINGGINPELVSPKPEAIEKTVGQLRLIAKYGRPVVVVNFDHTKLDNNNAAQSAQVRQVLANLANVAIQGGADLAVGNPELINDPDFGALFNRGIAPAGGASKDNTEELQKKRTENN